MMPLISRVMIRMAYVYLIAGMIIGGLILAEKAYSFWPGIWMFRESHIEMLLFGFIIQFTLGTGYWMLPRMLDEPVRGNEFLAWVMVAVLNLGVLIMATRPFWVPSLGSTTYGLSWFSISGIAGRSLELAGVLLFIKLHWKRIVTYRDLPHEH